MSPELFMLSTELRNSNYRYEFSLENVLTVTALIYVFVSKHCPKLSSVKR